MVKKKKKNKINNSDNKYLFSLYKQIGYMDQFYNSRYQIIIKEKVNKIFEHFVSQLHKYNLIPENIIYPSIFKIYLHDTQIKPFWNNDTQKLSDKLYLPTMDNLTYKYNVSRTFYSDTWFQVHELEGVQNKYYKLKTEINTDTNKDIIKCRKITLYLNKEQRSYMKQIISTYRYFYNRCVCYFNNYDKASRSSFYYIDPSDENTQIQIQLTAIDKPYNMISMRSYLKNNLPDWILDGYPSHLIDEAFSEAFNRFKTCLNMCIKKGIPFDFKYKTKKDKIHTINLERYMIKEKSNSLFSNWNLNGYVFRNLHTSEKFKKYNNIRGSTLSYNKRLDKYILNLTYKLKSYNSSGNNVAAMDPGIRRFEQYIRQIPLQ